MTSLPLSPTSSLPELRPHGLLARFARKLVHRRLAQLGGASLSLRDAHGTALFGQPGSELSAHVDVHRPGLYTRMLAGGPLGAAASYLDGDWDSPVLTDVFRVFLRGDAARTRVSRGLARLGRAAARLAHTLRANTPAGSRRNIREHYDLGNEFFGLFLDDTMSYSCLHFDGQGQSLTAAAEAKLDRLCQRLELGPGDRVLEIGTGWAGFAIHAARHYGCHVTTTTISPAQHGLALARIRAAGLQDRIELRLADYRELEGRFDKLVAIEMLEAVGHRYLGRFFATAERLLHEHGTMMLQVITMPGRRYREYLKTPDFIQRYVFPGSCCPSLEAILGAARRASDFEVAWMDDIGPHYAETLRQWRARFEARLDDVRALGYSERFVRLWRYYLAYCEAGFEERFLGDHQILLRRPRARVATQEPRAIAPSWPQRERAG